MFNRNNIVKSISVIGFMSLTVGCATSENIKLTNAESSLIDGKSVVFVSRELPSFITYITTGGDVLDFPQGRIQLDGLNINNPASTVGKELVNNLSKQHDMTTTVVNAPSTLEDGEQFLAAKYGANSDYILDSRITNWRIVQKTYGWGRYDLSYSSEVRLIDAKTAKVISQGNCSNIIEYDEGFEYSNLLDNNAKDLKQIIDQAATQCFDQFKLQALNV